MCPFCRWPFIVWKYYAKWNKTCKYLWILKAQMIMFFSCFVTNRLLHSFQQLLQRLSRNNVLLPTVPRRAVGNLNPFCAWSLESPERITFSVHPNCHFLKLMAFFFNRWHNKNDLYRYILRRHAGKQYIFSTHSENSFYRDSFDVTWKRKAVYILSDIGCQWYTLSIFKRHHISFHAVDVFATYSSE